LQNDQRFSKRVSVSQTVSRTGHIELKCLSFPKKKHFNSLDAVGMFSKERESLDVLGMDLEVGIAALNDSCSASVESYDFE